MEGFLNIRLRPWLRRLITRLIAIIFPPSSSSRSPGKAAGQIARPQPVVLSLQLSFAVIPLVMFTSDRGKMGEFVNSTG